MISFTVDKNSRTPFYTQLVRHFEDALEQGLLQDGEILPSMNVLAAELGISRETVKKAYSILRDKQLLDPRQGKGFYVRTAGKGKYLRVLVISDVHSIYKQLLLGAIQSTLSEKEGCDTTILLHNQDINLLRYYLDRNLDSYDWYLVAPHFPRDSRTRREVLKQLKRIPNRKLIMLDHWLQDLPGNYGAVYQDFSQDAFDALSEETAAFEGRGRLNVIAIQSSMYKLSVADALRRFAAAANREIVFSEGSPESILPGDICIILSSQHDSGLVALARKIREQGLVIGENVFIICYNDFPLNELVLGGLTTMSTDFEQMGRTAAGMILSGNLMKIHNPFRLIRRNTF